MSANPPRGDASASSFAASMISPHAVPHRPGGPSSISSITVERIFPSRPPLAHLDPSVAPPPYRAPSPTSITPLSFFPINVTSKRNPSHNRVNSSPFLPNFASPSSTSGTTAAAALPPPSYSEVPQTLAERCFVYGFLCPFVWFVGISKYWFPERPLHVVDDDVESISSIAKYFEERGGGRGDTRRVDYEYEYERRTIKESLDSWRREELLWSLRCAYGCGGAVCVAALAGIVIVAVLGKL